MQEFQSVTLKNCFPEAHPQLIKISDMLCNIFRSMTGKKKDQNQVKYLLKKKKAGADQITFYSQQMYWQEFLD